MDRNRLEEGLSQLPLFLYADVDPKELEFSQRVRQICRTECPMYGTNYACPPAVGTIEECREKCLRYENCLMISTVTEVDDIADLNATLATRKEHEEVTDQAADLLRAEGVEPFVLSTEACAICKRCAYLDGQPCRFPEKMHPCVESQGINIIPEIEKNGITFQYGSNIVTWFSLLFY